MKITLATIFFVLTLASTAWATFPTIVTTSNGVSAAVVDTNHVVTLPTGLASGDLLFICISINGTRSMTYTGAGMTEIFDGPTQSSGVTLSCGYKIATGAEGATVTLTSDVSEISHWVAWRVSGAHSTTPPECNTPTGSASGTAADALALNPSAWDVEDTLWLVIVGSGSNNTMSGVPTDYSNCLGPASSSISVDLKACSRNNAVASEDPGSMTIQSSIWSAVTCGVRPAAVVTTTPRGVGRVGKLL